MKVFVFSYNRGDYLGNSLASVLRHIPDADVTVVDDDSDDPAVHRVLNKYADRIVVDRPGVRSNAYLGGLYDNMARVVAANNAIDRALFIQDDMQVVRDVDAVDLAAMERFFQLYPRALNLNTTFMKRSRAEADRACLRFEPEVPVYFRDGARRAHFSAVGVMNLRYLNESGFTFRGTEGANNDAAGGFADPMGFAFAPFMMWLPFPCSTKFGRRTLFHRMAEWWFRAGFYPYRPMAAEAVSRLRDRDASELPVAEHFLDPEGLGQRGDWLFEDATKSVKSFHRILKKRKKQRAGET